MKMGDRKGKRLDGLGMRSINKPRLTDNPSNRAERRAAERAKRKFRRRNEASMSIVDIKRPENSHIWEREQHEHYVEPSWCSRRLFDVETFIGAIDDPFCGFGAIPKAAALAGHNITSSDIVDRGYGHGDQDFFKSIWGRDNIVSNPPFDRFREVAEHALGVTARKVALIWLVRTLPAARWLASTPLARIRFLTPRPSMPPGHTITAGEKPGGGKQDFCWVIWDMAHVGPPTVSWLHRDGRDIPKSTTRNT